MKEIFKKKKSRLGTTIWVKEKTNFGWKAKWFTNNIPLEV